MADLPGGDKSGDQLPSTVTGVPLTVPGGDFGPYRLLEQLGVGGMGEVWLVEQTSPIRRLAALKVIKAGMDTDQFIARFEAERQALAVMDHPGIAKVFEAGATSAGRPYFAMEYVKGEPLTAYCDRHRLSTRARLELFVHVCEAVHHAHQKGIIHRDLKPSNILVTQQDERPAPKIIDFGVAKAMSRPLTEHALHTMVDGFVGTLEYLSPEQAGGGGADVDTRTDVYALGVILYELLTGTLPFDGRLLREKGVEDFRRTIREVEPARPSTAITRMRDTSGDVAHRRQTVPARLASLLRGDLDWITMKAIEKDRQRRYGSASDLAADVTRHLQNQAVLAGPPGIAYRSRKFVTRHWFGVTAAAVLILVLVAFAGSMTLQAQRIARERDRANAEAEAARQVSAFLVGLFEVSKPSEQTANSITAREILDRGAEQIRLNAALAPGTRAVLLTTMGDVYSSLSLRQTALGLHREALALRRETFGPESLEAAESKMRVGQVLRGLDRLPEAETMQRDALALRRAHRGDNHPDVGAALSALGATLSAAGRYQEAEAFFREALSIQRRHPGTDAAISLRGLAGVLLFTGQADKAETAFREALDMHARELGPGHPEALADAFNVGNALVMQQRYAEAEAIYRHNLAETIRTHGPEHLEVAVSLNNLGAVQFYQERYEDAESAYRRSLGIYRRAYQGDHSDIARGLLNLAEALNAQGRHAEALPEIEAGTTMIRRLLGDSHPSLAFALIVSSQTLLGLSRATEAEAAAREALNIATTKLGSDHERAIEAERALAAALAARQ